MSCDDGCGLPERGWWSAYEAAGRNPATGWKEDD
jgi:hypothetical protein